MDLETQVDHGLKAVKNSKRKEERKGHDQNSTKFVRLCSRANLAGHYLEASLATTLDTNEMGLAAQDKEATLPTIPLFPPTSMFVTSLYL
jgi:hypothetical protein